MRLHSKRIAIEGRAVYVNPLSDHRKILWIRQDQKCFWCGNRMIQTAMYDREGKADGRQATIDHVIPISNEGTNLASNLVLACRICNETRAKYHSMKKDLANLKEIKEENKRLKSENLNLISQNHDASTL